MVTLDDDPPRRVQPQPGSLADLLGGEERVEDVVADVVAGCPGPSSAMSTSAQSPSARVVIVIVPLVAEDLDRVGEQVGPHLVELGAVHREPPSDGS